jgi:DNA-binding transcriptional MocR family regulator
VEAISDLPMLNDIDADYTPQYVKLARVLRDKIESGEYNAGDLVPAARLAREHDVSVKVAWSALAMLAANRYLARTGPFDPYHVIPGATRARPRERG